MQNSIFDIFGSHQSNVLPVSKSTGQHKIATRPAAIFGSTLHNLKGGGGPSMVLKQKSTPMKTVLGDVGNRISKQHLSFKQNQPLQKKRQESPSSKKIVINKSPRIINKMDSKNEIFEINDIFVDSNGDDDCYYEDLIPSSLCLTKEDIYSNAHDFIYPKKDLIYEPSPPGSPLHEIEQALDFFDDSFMEIIVLPEPCLDFDISLPELPEEEEE